MDVQGLEYEVLNGGCNLFSNYKIPILLEYEKIYDNKNLDTKQNLEKFLFKRNYQIYKVNKLKLGFLEKIKSLSISDGNFLCLPS